MRASMYETELCRQCMGAVYVQIMVHLLSHCNAPSPPRQQSCPVAQPGV